LLFGQAVLAADKLENRSRGGQRLQPGRSLVLEQTNAHDVTLCFSFRPVAGKFPPAPQGNYSSGSLSVPSSTVFRDFRGCKVREKSEKWAKEKNYVGQGE